MASPVKNLRTSLRLLINAKQLTSHNSVKSSNKPTMKTIEVDPWVSQSVSQTPENGAITCFEDSFVTSQDNSMRLDDSDQYLQRLCKSFKLLIKCLIKIE